jgi:hypothetical protein
MFYKKMLILLLHLLTMSLAIYSRPPFKDGLMNGFKAGEDAPELTDIDIMRYICTIYIHPFYQYFSDIALRLPHFWVLCLSWFFNSERK